MDEYSFLQASSKYEITVEKVREQRVDSSCTLSTMSYSFSADILNIKNGKVDINTKVPTIERQLLSEYFSTAGMGDIESEVAKVDTYINLFEERLLEKRKKTKELCKLYRTVGFLCGLFLSIFMI